MHNSIANNNTHSHLCPVIQNTNYTDGIVQKRKPNLLVTYCEKYKPKPIFIIIN